MMGALRRARPSASLVVAIAAMVVAVSGTAIAATKLVNGSDAGGGQATSEVDVTSTDANSSAEGTPLSATPFLLATNTDSAFSVSADVPWTFLASSGKAWFAELSAGNKYLGKDCFGTALVNQD